MKWLWVAAFVALAGVAGCSMPPTSAPVRGDAPVKYESTAWSDGSRLVLQCDRAGVSSLACQFWKEGEARPAERKTAAEFMPLGKNQQYLKRLVGESAVEAVKNPQGQREAPIASRDVTLLQDLTASQESCLADRKYADLLLACPAHGQDSNIVVMFFRGLCDRCRFQPVVLRKVN
jgi:hypothetical protein